MIDPRAFVDALEVVGVGVYFVDPERRITFWSAGATQVSGWTADEVLGRSCADNILVHVDACGKNLCEAGCPLSAAIHDGNRHQGSVFMRHKDGHRVPVLVRTLPLRDAEGRVLGGIEVFTDTSERLSELEKLKTLEAAVYVDPLTAIPNRRFFETAHQGRISEARRLGNRFFVAIADIDHFKQVNDRWGHLAGDRVLVSVARTLLSASRSLDVVARWGGEEFAILLACTDAEGARMALERRRNLVAGTHTRNGEQDLQVTISVGAAAADPDEPAEATIARADAALYEAKAGGRNRVVVHA